MLAARHVRNLCSPRVSVGSFSLDFQPELDDERMQVALRQVHAAYRAVTLFGYQIARRYTRWLR